MFERSLLIQPKQLLLMVVDKWVDMYLQPLLQLVDDESKRGAINFKSESKMVLDPDSLSSVEIEANDDRERIQ